MKNHTKIFSLIAFHTKLWLLLNLIRFDKIDGFTRVYDGTRDLSLFGSEKYGFIYTRIR